MITELHYEAHFIRRQAADGWYIEVTDRLEGGLPVTRQFGPFPRENLDQIEAELRCYYTRSFQGSVAMFHLAFKGGTVSYEPQIRQATQCAPIICEACHAQVNQAAVIDDLTLCESCAYEIWSTLVHSRYKHGLATQDDSHPTTVDAQPGTALE